MRTVSFQTLIDEGLLQIGDGYRAKLEELGGSGHPFLRSEFVDERYIAFDDAECFHEKLTPKLKAKLSRPGDTVITTKGNSTGRAAYVRKEFRTFVYSPHLSFWRSLDHSRLHPGFLREWAHGPEFIDQLNGMKDSTDMAPYLSLTDQRRLRITVPEPEAQRAIARVLGALDDKVELNRRVNRTLEELAGALFRAWFVDFEPVVAKAAGRAPFGLAPAVAALFPATFTDSELGPIPLGWRVGTIGEIADNPRRMATPSAVAQDTPYIGLEHLPRKSICLMDSGTAADVSSGKSHFKSGEFLFGKLRPYFHKVGVALCDGVCSTDVLVVTPRAEEWFGLLLGHLSSGEFIDYTDAASGGTRMPRTSWHDMKRYRIALPPGTLAQELTKLYRSAEAMFATHRKESRALAALRDTLLPKLLSGELRVKAAEKLAKAQA